MFVSIHIPKTAGTSLGEVFDLSSGRKVFWDYDSGYRYALNVQKEISDGISFIESYFHFIHGHFFYLKYSTLLPNARFISCVRHPVDRVVSQYYHVAYGGDVSAWQADHIRRGEMGLVEYVKSDPNISSAMCKHLDGRRPEDFDFIFVTESLNRDLISFSKKFNYPITIPLSTKNLGQDRISLASRSGLGRDVRKVSEEDRKRVYGLCLEDVELYVKCQNLVK